MWSALRPCHAQQPRHAQRRAQHGLRPAVTIPSLARLSGHTRPFALQVVVFLLQHGPQGSLGLILNRPTSLKMGRGRGGLPMSLDVSALPSLTFLCSGC